VAHGKTFRFGLLISLYLSQGLPFGFFTQALPALMREQGVSLKGIGLSSLLALPWALKFLWAPTVDRLRGGRFGARRTWIIPLQILSIIILALIAFTEPTDGLFWILVGVFAINLCASTHDIATDGLAVEILKPSERGVANGIQVGAYRLGMILGGGVLLLFLAELGWRHSFFMMCACLAIALFPISRYTEGHTHTEPGSSTRSALSGYFRTNQAWAWVVLIILYKGLDSLVGPMVKPMMVDAGYSLGTIGSIQGVAGSASALVGAVAGGLGVQYLGRRQALMSFGVLQVLAVGLFIVPAMGAGGIGALYLATILDSLLGSMATAALFTAMMDRCRPEQAGTDYTIQASIVVVTQIGMASLSGFVAEALGYTGHFIATMSLSALGLVGVYRLLQMHSFGLVERDVPEDA